MRIFLLPITRSRTLLFAQNQGPLPRLLASPLPSSGKATEAAGSPLAAASSTAEQQHTSRVDSRSTKSANESIDSPSAKEPWAVSPGPSGQNHPTAAEPTKAPWMDRISHRVARIWSEWERRDAGWQKRVVTYGNAALRRIAFEEWGLKSVAPLTRAQRARWEAVLHPTSSSSNSATHGTVLPTSTSSNSTVSSSTISPVQVYYPSSMIPVSSVASLLQRLATEREPLHRRRLWWCVIGLPISAPFGLVPIVPNLPFFYLAYRAYSHWRALAGGQHLQFLQKHSLLDYVASPYLDQVYADVDEGPARRKTGTESTKTTTTTTTPKTDETPDSPSAPVTEQQKPGAEAQSASSKVDPPPQEAFLLQPRQIRDIAETFGAVELVAELERAAWQVENLVPTAQK